MVFRTWNFVHYSYKSKMIFKNQVLVNYPVQIFDINHKVI